MSKKKTLSERIQAIHEALEQAEYQLSQLGERLQYLIGPDGSIRIVRRDKTGETVWPATTVAELKGCDPMFWRPEYPQWLRSLDPGRDKDAAAGNGTPHPPAEETEPKNGGSETPTPGTEDN